MNYYLFFYQLWRIKLTRRRHSAPVLSRNLKVCVLPLDSVAGNIIYVLISHLLVYIKSSKL